MIKKAYLAAFLCSASLLHADVIVNFDDLTLAPNSYHNNPAFQSYGAGFNNFYDTTYSSWAGFAYSNVTNHTTGGYGNQYASAATSTGIYAVGYVDTYNDVTPNITLPLGVTQPISINITNTAYAYDAIVNGDSFANKFVEGDWFLLTIEGWDSLNESTGTIDFYLADYRSDNAANWYALNIWSTVDLTSLGSNVSSLAFSLSSSDSGAWGMNTPAYFAMDDLVLVPEPGTYALLALGMGIVWWRIRRQLSRIA